ncbi:MAG: DUF456 domain-containing protein [Actinomycetota bacterium]
MFDLGPELELLCGLAIALGIVGTVVPVLPGAVLIGGSVLVWALLVAQSAAGWVTLAVVVALLAAGQVVKYYTAGRHLTASGVPRRSLVLAGLAAIAGFFVVPVVGLVLFFVGALYLAERARLGPGPGARRSTVTALKAVGVAILVELTAALLAGTVWLVAAVQLP